LDEARAVKIGGLVREDAAVCNISIPPTARGRHARACARIIFESDRRSGGEAFNVADDGMG
jgi:hypothetical protein